MCAVVCEVPDSMVACNNSCPTYCDPCSAPTDYPPCGPGDACGQRCDCGDNAGCCYQQPARTQPIRPQGCIFRSSAPMETDTIYKRSFYGNCGDCYRAKPVLPCSNLGRSTAPLEKCTIQKLSYMPHCCVARTQPIRPPENGLKFNGPLYAMTSQKHDFVPKGYSKREAIRPINGICKVCDPLERCTINKLSYMPVDVCQHRPPRPIVQTANIQRATGRSEKCTVQKLSYMPCCLPGKEPMPWADKIRCIPPRYENLCTTYNLSYMPNCNAGRTAAVMPISGLKFLGTDRNDGNTVYKLSYMPVDARCCRPSPILPSNALCMPSGPLERCTVQKLSYQPNCCAPRTQAIRPPENGLKFNGPLYAMTSQKHDFVPKGYSKRQAIRPINGICKVCDPLESCTINRLSYMPVNVCEHRRPAPVLPRPGVGRNDGPIDKCTTYKLSYLPNCVQPKPDMPWARYSSYVKPTTPIEKCTIQRLSYGPPGTFSKCGGSCNQGGGDGPGNYPKAGIC